MAPRFDKATQQWVPTKPEEGPEGGYDIWKTLLLQGPKPFFTRLFQPNDYEQAVLKYMASDGCSREEAQGNMDAYLENFQDWTYQKLQEKKGGFKKDYTRIDKKQGTRFLKDAAAIELHRPRLVALATG